MDDQSLTTILDLLRADAQEFSQTNPNAQNDLDPVVRAWQEEGDRYASQSVDYRVAMSLARVIQQDRQTLGAFSDEESRAATDRLLAIRLAQEEVHQQPEQAQGGQPDQPRGKSFSFFIQVLVVSCADLHDRWIVRPQPPTQQPQATCVACTETLLQTDVTTAPCSHIYCRDCTIKLFEDSLRDETLFPPRCCRTAIPLPLVQHFLSPDIRREFENKTVEYNDGNRTYCSSPICSRYLHPFPNPRVNGRYCARCNLWTCIRCKKSHYPGNACPDENEGMLQLAKKSGWRRCSRCKNMVELRTGCNHITYVFLWLLL